MFRNYLKTAFRNFQNQKVFSFINIAGLSIGIACFCLLALYSYNELSFDKFNRNAENIYRPYVWFHGTNEYPAIGYMDYSGPTAPTLGEALKKKFPDVMNYVRIQLPYDESLLRVEDKGFRSNVTYADQSLFSIFSFPLEYGNAQTALHNLNDVVLTASKAKEIFGKENAIGESIEIKIANSFQPFIVTAIAKDIPANSTIRFDVLGNFQYAEKYVNGSNFTGSDFHYIEKQTFVQLKPGNKLPNDSKRLKDFLASFNPTYLDDLKKSGISWSDDDMPVSLRLQHLVDIHTSTINLWHDFPRIDLRTIWILLAIAFGILLIACINFTTLAIGRSAGRSREVGVRKVMGAAKRNIISQFMAESYLLAIISTVLGLLLATILLPYFNELSGSQLRFSVSFFPHGLLLAACIVCVVGLLAGSYPAFVLSGFKPVAVLKSKMRIGGANTFTKSLVTFQFVLSIVLIVSTVIMLQQTNYMLNKNPGFNKDNVLAIDASETNPGNIFPLFKQAILNLRSVEGVASAAAGLGAGQNYLGYSDNGLSADINIIDTSYISVLGLKLIAGSNFTEAQINDTIKSIIINETMMKAFGWTSQKAVGQEIKNFQGRNAIVTGVVKNFSYRSLSEDIKNQLFITSKDKGYVNFYVRLRGNKQRLTVAAIQKKWNDLMPGIPMKYSFLDADIDKYYTSEETWSKIVGWASGISIFLASLGLLGLASLAAVNRTKEVGVRKVLGASVPGVAVLLSKDFLRLVLMAIVIASPAAWWLMNSWLNNFACRINIKWWVLAVAGLFTILIALITVSFQAIKAAIANPVKSLRTE